MSKSLILILGGGAAAFLAYRLIWAKNPMIPGSAPKNAAGAKASNSYPSHPVTPPRVDNANQPWYNNSKVPLQYANPQPSGLVGLAQQVSAGASIVNSLSDVWGNVSDMFEGSNNIGSADETLPDPMEGDAA